MMQGLTQQEAKNRLRQDGKNELAEAPKSKPVRMFLGQFRDVMVMILLAATMVSVLLGEWTERSRLRRFPSASSGKLIQSSGDSPLRRRFSRMNSISSAKPRSGAASISKRPCRPRVSISTPSSSAAARRFRTA